MTRPLTRCLLIAGVMALLAPLAWGSPPGALWGSDVPGAGVLPFGREDLERSVVFGPAGCPIAEVGGTIWDLKKDALTVNIPYAYSNHPLGAINGSGTLIALARNLNGRGHDDDDSNPDDITVWNTRTGQKVCSISASQRERGIEWISIAGETSVLVSGRGPDGRKPVMEVWDIATGKLTRRFECNFSGPQSTALSPDGHYVAVSDWDYLNLYDVTTGKLVTSLTPPAANGGFFRIEANAGGIHIHEANDGFVNMNGLAFSPDGSQLAAEFGGQRMVVWDNAGKIVADRRFVVPGGGGNSTTSPVVWTPTGDAVLAGGSVLFDPKLNIPVWIGSAPQFGWSIAGFTDEDHFMRSDMTSVERVEIPWTAIHHMTAALHEAANAPAFGAGHPVALHVTLIHCRGDQARLTDILKGMVTGVLKERGIIVADSAPMTVDLTLEEKSGAAVPIVIRHDPFGNSPIITTDRTAQPVRALFTMAIRAKDQGAPAFEWNFYAGTQDTYTATITDDLLNDNLVDGLARFVEAAPLPSFISAVDPTVQLPLHDSSSIDLAGPRRSFEGVERPIDRLIEIIPPASPAAPGAQHAPQTG